MQAYKNVITAALSDGDFDVASDALSDLLRKGFIPNKAILNAMLNAMNVQNPRQLSALVPSEGTQRSFGFLLFVLDSMTARNLPIESCLYVSILSLGNLIGGRAKRVAGKINQSRATSESAGTQLLSSGNAGARNDGGSGDEASWDGWYAVFQDETYDEKLDSMTIPQINVRVQPKDIRFVLKAETASSISKSRKRKPAMAANSL